MNEEQVYLEKFGDNVQRRRNELGLSYRELAQKCDVDFSAISKIEKGNKGFEFKTIIELAKGLEVHPQKLFEFDFPIDNNIL